MNQRRLKFPNAANIKIIKQMIPLWNRSLGVFLAEQHGSCVRSELRRAALQSLEIIELKILQKKKKKIIRLNTNEH